MGYGNFKLYYVRTLDNREIDFLIVRDSTSLMAIEVKTSDSTLSAPLKNRQAWFPGHPTLGIQLVNRPGILKKYPDNTWVMSIERFLNLLL